MSGSGPVFNGKKNVLSVTKIASITQEKTVTFFNKVFEHPFLHVYFETTALFLKFLEEKTIWNSAFDTGDSFHYFTKRTVLVNVKTLSYFH